MCACPPWGGFILVVVLRRKIIHPFFAFSVIYHVFLSRTPPCLPNRLFLAIFFFLSGGGDVAQRMTGRRGWDRVSVGPPVTLLLGQGPGCHEVLGNGGVKE